MSSPPSLSLTRSDGSEAKPRSQGHASIWCALVATMHRIGASFSRPCTDLKQGLDPKGSANLPRPPPVHQCPSSRRPRSPVRLITPAPSICAPHHGGHASYQCIHPDDPPADASEARTPRQSEASSADGRPPVHLIILRMFDSGASSENARKALPDGSCADRRRGKEVGK